MEPQAAVEPAGDAYETPVLVEVGAYADLTHGTPIGVLVDGGEPPHNVMPLC